MSNFGYPVEYSGTRIAKLDDVEASSPSDGDVIKYNSSEKKWKNSSTSTSAPAGADKQVQFNDAGSLSASADMTFDKSTKTLTAHKITDNFTEISNAVVTGTQNMDTVTMDIKNIAQIGSNGHSASIGFHGATPVTQADKSTMGAVAFNPGTSNLSDGTATFGGWNMGQVVKALIDIGILKA